MTRKRLKPRLSERGWRIGSEDAEYWKCSKFNVWCGGFYRPELKLCKNCLMQRYNQRKGGSTRRNVFTIFNKHKINRRAAGGGNLFISYNSKLFCVKKSRCFAFGRVLYERVTKKDLGDKKVLILRTATLPEFEDLIIVPKNSNVSERSLMDQFLVRA